MHLGRLKDDLVATVSHELRAPMTSITAALALLNAGGAGRLPEPAQRLVAIAHSNGLRLVRLINDILDIEKLESGQMAFDLQLLDVKAVVEQSIELNRTHADELAVRVGLDPASSSGFVRADVDRLMQVVTNLISNAVKFSPPDADVVVATTCGMASVRITVRDHGPGIPDEFKLRIFDRFSQANTGDRRPKGGSGLGLSIARQIVNRLNGKVGFESIAGQGALFYVELPRVSREQVENETRGQEVA